MTCKICGEPLDSRAADGACYLCQPDDTVKNTDIANIKHNDLLPLYPTRRKFRRTTIWCCRCDCGNLCLVNRTNIITGNTKSCGCRKHRLHDITGQRFGKLVAICVAEVGKTGAVWTCKCDCGNTVKVRGNLLLSGAQISCGCSRAGYESLKRDHFEGTQMHLLTSAPTKANTTGVRGVSFDCARGLYRATLRIKGKAINIGRFATLEDAAKARAQAEETYFEPVKELYVKSKKE